MGHCQKPERYLRNTEGAPKNDKIRTDFETGEDNPHLYQRDVERIVSTIFDEISTALARGDRVELRGFGAFSVKTREARQVAIHEPANPSASRKIRAVFKSGKDLRDRLNGRK